MHAVSDSVLLGQNPHQVHPPAPSLGSTYMGLWPFLQGLSFPKRIEGQSSGKCPVKRPNIVLFVGDDLGWNDVSFHGPKMIPTPNIDILANDGIILNQYYTQPICTPSRGSLMTGKYPMRLGLQHFVIGSNTPWGLPLKEKLLPQYLKELGYSTHAVGKWHLGYYKDDFTPQRRGFDSFFGYYNGVEDYFTHYNIDSNMTGLDLHDDFTNIWDYYGTYGTDLFTQKAKEVIEAHDKSKPLFLYFSQQAPHSGNFDDPLQAPATYSDPMAFIEDNKTRTYAGMVSSLDHSLGETMRTLSETGMLNDTLLIFIADNGGATRDVHETCGSNWPLKGAKFTLWEGGVRGDSFIWSSSLRGRKQEKCRIYDELVHVSDWLPTILSAAGGPEALKVLPNHASGIDGIDHWPSIGDCLPSRRKEILLNLDSKGKAAAYRKGKYKLVIGTYEDGIYDKWYDTEGRAFNLSYSLTTRRQKEIYQRNYEILLSDSTVAKILKANYGKESNLVCNTPTCKQKLDVKCGGLPPETSDCDPNEPCLFDLENDPCEFHNIAEEHPEVVAELLLAIEKYRPFEIPSGEKPLDYRADPKLHGGAWVPWL